MRVLILWADASQPNLGVRALAQGARALVLEAFPGAEIEVRGPGQHGDGPMNLTHISPLVKERVRPTQGLNDWMRSFDFVLDMRGGDSFTDIYGVKRLAKMSVAPELFRQLGVPIVLGPQTIGPFTTLPGKAVGAYMMRIARGVMVRDDVSADVAAAMGRTADVRSSDVVFALPQPSAPFSTDSSLDVVLNVSGLLWFPNRHVNHEAYRALVHRAVDACIARGRNVALLAHVLPVARMGTSMRESDMPSVSSRSTDDNDIWAIASVADYMRRRHHVDPEALLPKSLTHARSLIGSGRVLIGARMHACLNALSCGVPAIPMAYSRKFAPLLEGIGWDRTVGIDDPDAGERLVASLDDEGLDNQASEVVERARQRNDAAVTWLREHLGRRPR